MKRKLDDEPRGKPMRQAPMPMVRMGANVNEQPTARQATLKASGQPSSSSYAFEVTDDRDHAETPFQAYADLEPILYKLCTRLKKTRRLGYI